MSDHLRQKLVFYAAFAALLSAFTVGAYFLTARFLKDRQAAVARLSRPAQEDRWKSEGMTRRANNAAVPQGAMPVPAAPPAATSGEAAIQRQLKTLDEINRINEMNRRLMDEQRRQNRR